MPSYCTDVSIEESFLRPRWEIFALYIAPEPTLLVVCGLLRRIFEFVGYYCVVDELWKN